MDEVEDEEEDKEDEQTEDDEPDLLEIGESDSTVHGGRACQTPLPALFA